MVSMFNVRASVYLLIDTMDVDGGFCQQSKDSGHDVDSFPYHLTADLTCDWLTTRKCRSSQSQQPFLPIRQYQHGSFLSFGGGYLV